MKNVRRVNGSIKRLPAAYNDVYLLNLSVKSIHEEEI